MGCVDRDLIKRAQRGDAEAFERLFERFERDIYTLAYRITNSEEDAEDILQSVALKMWEHLKNFRGDSSLWTWLYRITVNESLRVLKSKKYSVKFQPWHSPKTEKVELVLAIEDMVRRLPERQRIALVMRDIYNFSMEEIARTLETTPGAVRAILYRARRNLRSMWVGRKTP